MSQHAANSGKGAGKNISFEDAVKKLESIVDEMESGEVDLDKALARFEEGIKLVRLCTSKLEEAKKKVEILVKKDGKMTPEPFRHDRDENVPGSGRNDLSD